MQDGSNPRYDVFRIMNGALLDIKRLQDGPRTRRIGRRIEYFPSTTSTNDEAWRLIDKGADDGLVVLAEYQSAGRGRLGRTWESPRGASLLASVVLISRHDELTGGDLGLIAAVAVVDAVTSTTDVTPAIKWPNDILVEGRKLGGILIESRRRDTAAAFVVGIGLNCLQQHGHLTGELASLATSLDLESTGPIDRTALAVALLTELDRWLAEPAAWTDGDLRRAWLARAEPMGQRIRLRHAGKVYCGSMVDLDPTAALVVRLDEGGVRVFNAAETTVVERDPTAGT